ncbi:MAG: WD40 repeat domain-containing protein [Arcobacteraceae bacterium]|jgi:WD40 repeat protein|nr:WD40 repeat domain-containing protein [Arcobacteraceae bacterium]
MLRLIISLLFVLNLGFAQVSVEPKMKVIASGDVQDMVISDNTLYVATDASKVDIFDLNTKTLIKSIQIPTIKDFMGKEINSKIYSVDVLGNAIIFVSEGEGGYRVLWKYAGEKLEKLVDTNKKHFIREARFVDKSRVLMGLLTNEHIMYDIAQKKVIYNTQFSTSSFSDFTLSEDKTKYVTTDESGIVRVVDTKTSNVLEELPAKNVDRVYQLDYKKGVVLTAGQDRRAVVYKPFGTYYLEFDFLLYASALNTNATLGAVAYNIQNDVLVFDVESKQKLYSLTGARATITKILFVNDNELLVSSDSKQINYYKLK